MTAGYLSDPQLSPLVQTVDESGRQPDVVPDNRFVVCQAVDGANTPTQISVDHWGQFTVSELRHTRRSLVHSVCDQSDRVCARSCTCYKTCFNIRVRTFW